jgi:hypothetical protein
VEAPLNKNQHSILKTHQVHQMNEEPDEPRDRAAQAESSKIGNRRKASDHGKISFIEVAERLGWFIAQPAYDRLRNVLPLLHGDGCNSR